MAPYDEFAWFYNRYWNEEFHAAAFPILEKIWLERVNAGRHAEKRAHILDVCSGTGYLAGLLVAQGYRVTGLDLSPRMVEFARDNVPEAEFHVGDAAHLSLSGPFDAAVSTFDSLNHILDREDLEAAFRNTAASLRAGAPFAFDMLLEDAYRIHWGESFALVREDHVLTITASGYDFRTRRACCTITMFRLVEGAWRRSDVTIQERCYTPEEIDRALALAGFGDVCCYDAGDLGMAGDLGEGRTFFVAVKE
jgi:SAM-dependent methyltransferase